MSQSFLRGDNLLRVGACLWGPKGSLFLVLALDTGSSKTIIANDAFEMVGYDVNTATDFVRLTTGSGTVTAPRLAVSKLDCLDCSKFDFEAVAYTLPSNADVDGVLGLDFLRDHRLTIDFPKGLITLE